MTEYDYSPEAYERYLATQRRISNWVDKTEGSRSQFADALQPPASHMPGFEQAFQTEGPAQRRAHRRQHRSRSPSPDCEELLYSRGPHAPGPMPPMHSAPGHLGTFPQHQMPFQHHTPSPPPTSPHGHLPPSYYGTPTPNQLKAHRRSQSQAPRPHYAPPPPLVLSPPVSPGVYSHPASPTGYVMIPQQPMPMMSPPAPNSAPAHITAFAQIPLTPPPPQSGGYFQMQPHQAQPVSFSAFLAPPGAPPGAPMYAYSTSSGIVSPPHSAYPEIPGFTTLVSPMQSPALAPMYPHVAVQSPTTAGATSPGYAYVYPSTGLHQRVYEMTGQNKHLLRRSIG